MLTATPKFFGDQRLKIYASQDGQLVFVQLDTMVDSAVIAMDPLAASWASDELAKQAAIAAIRSQQ
jgi:hypothetical protein